MFLGKLLGIFLGFLLGARGGLLGAILGMSLGAYIGTIFDKGLRFSGQGLNFSNMGSEISQIFFHATFAVMGYIAKADGRVSTKEIKLAEHIMHTMGLEKAQRLKAIAYFNEGKDSNFNWQALVYKLKDACVGRRDILHNFIEIQIELAYVDGNLNKVKQQVLIELMQLLGYARPEFFRFDDMFRARQRYYSYEQTNYQGRTNSKQKHYASINDAYAVLGVKTTTSTAEVKKAYRKLMSQHHPDKLQAKGLPPEMLKLATEKTIKIKAAYDEIMQQRKS